MVKFETLTFPAADIGPLNPMPDIKNVSYIHAGYEMTPRVHEDEKTYIGKGMIPTMLPYQLQDGYILYALIISKSLRRFPAEKSGVLE